MGYKIYYKSGYKNRYEQYDGKTYSTKEAAQKSMMNSKKRFGDIWKKDKAKVEIRAAGSNIKKKKPSSGGWWDIGW